jgi:uncharacterized damage-inducible protein DinB
MITPRTARMMTRYNAWSNRLWFDAIAALPPGEATKERKSLFKNMVHTLNHNYVIDVMWQAHIEGRDHGLAARNTPDHPPLAELWRKQQEIDAWYIKWADALTDAEMDKRSTVTLVGGNQVSMSRGEMLLHVYHHTSYHRGFVGDMLYEVPDCRPPVTDLPVFLREAPQDY